MVALLLDMSGDSDNDGTLDGVGGVAKQNRVSSSEHGVGEEMGGEEEGGGGGGRRLACRMPLPKRPPPERGVLGVTRSEGLAGRLGAGAEATRPDGRDQKG